MRGFRAQHIRQRQLSRRVHGKRQVLMHFAQLSADGRRGHAVPYLPAGHMVGLTKRRDGDSTLAKLRMGQHAGMPFLSKADVLVDFIAQDVNFPFGDSLPQRGKIGFLPHRRRRVMRRIQDHQTGFVTQQRSKRLPVRAEMRRLERHAFHHAAGEFNRRRIAVVARIKADDFIPRAHQRGDGRVQRFGCPCRHRDVGVRIGLMAIQLRRFVGNRFPQRLHARHRRILIRPLRHVIRQTRLQISRAVEIREPLRKVNGVVLLRQGAHLRKDGGTEVGKFTLRNQGVNAHCVVPACNTYVAATITRC